MQLITLLLVINYLKRGHLKLKEVHSLLFFKLLAWQLPNEYSSVLQQPERINYIPQMLKLSLENKLYRKASWSDISSQRKCILGKILLWCVCMHVCICVCVYVFEECSKGMDERWILSRNDFTYCNLHSILPISPGKHLNYRKPQKWYPMTFL